MVSYATRLPKLLEQTATSIFFEKPDNLFIHEDSVTKYATSRKIETLIQELSEKGPLIASGEFGPAAYVVEPFKLKEKICEQDIYGWKSAAERIKNHCKVLILGAKIIKEKGFVFFTLSVDLTADQDSYFRHHQPSNIDKKIYILSYESFHNYLFDLYPPAKSAESQEEKLDTKKLKLDYIEKLRTLPFDSILDGKKGEKKCKAIGQEIFDKFKKECGSSLAGKEAAQSICDAIKPLQPDGKLLSKHIEYAWDGIGDENWRWKH